VNLVRSCRDLLVLGLVASFVLACRAEDGEYPAPAVTTSMTVRELDASPSSQTPMPLDQVRFWAYQLQELGAPGAVDALVNSRYDLLVLEPTRTDWSSGDRTFDTKGMVTRLKASPASDGTHRKLVLAYVNLGEAEDWRWYWTWSRGWKCRGKPPEDWPRYVLACDPDGWGGDYPVAYWEPAWKDLLLYGLLQGGEHPGRDYYSIVGEVIQDGFDGIYLDWVEAFDDPQVAAAARQAGLDPADEMVALIREIRVYATARNPEFRIIQQNAVSLMEGHPGLLELVDAIAQEAVWFDGEATDDWGDSDGYDRENDEQLTDYYLGYLEQYAEAGLPTFVCEYALEHAGRAYAKAYAMGLVPYVTRTPLSRLTTTVPPGY
jgi:cysteinyl-tRNA synthetase